MMIATTMVMIIMSSLFSPIKPLLCSIRSGISVFSLNYTYSAKSISISSSSSTSSTTSSSGSSSSSTGSSTISSVGIVPSM